MKASELIKLLEAEIDKYGDLEVKYRLSDFDTSPWIIRTYTKDGDNPSVINTATEIFIH